MQFIMSDYTRTQFNDNSLNPNQWQDAFIPKNTIIYRVEMMYRKLDSALIGLKFEDRDGTLLLTVGNINDPNYRNENQFNFKEFLLE